MVYRWEGNHGALTMAQTAAAGYGNLITASLPLVEVSVQILLSLPDQELAEGRDRVLIQLINYALTPHLQPLCL